MYFHCKVFMWAAIPLVFYYYIEVIARSVATFFHHDWPVGLVLIKESIDSRGRRTGLFQSNLKIGKRNLDTHCTSIGQRIIASSTLYWNNILIVGLYREIQVS